MPLKPPPDGYERRVILFGAALLILLLLFPPWRIVAEVSSSSGHIRNTTLIGHRSIFFPPNKDGAMAVYSTAHIDFERISVLILLVVVVDVTALWLVRGSPRRSAHGHFAANSQGETMVPRP